MIYMHSLVQWWNTREGPRIGVCRNGLLELYKSLIYAAQ